MKEKTRILVVDDDPIVCEGVEELLEHEGYSVFVTHSGQEALDMLREESAELVLLDLRLRQESGLDLLPRLKMIRPEASVVILTAFGTIETAVEAMRRGADNFVQKPVDPKKLLVVLEKGLEAYRLRRLAARVERLTPTQPVAVAESEEMRQLLRWAQTVAERETTVLLCGETGTGKSLIARSIHQASRRAAGPIVEINCAGIPHDLVESELFGHEKGAFTGAVQRKIGLFEAADGGTLFLDEIADLDLSTQAKLLSAVDVRRFRRVGGVTEIRVDVRLVAATNQSLERAMEEGRFRADLYYRLNTVKLEIPPLRNRRDDILPLGLSFLNEFSGADAKAPGISPEVQVLLLNYPWPGNVRELKNVMERASLLCPPGSEILPAHLPPLESAAAPQAAVSSSPARLDPGQAPVDPDDPAPSPHSGRISVASAEAERSVLHEALRDFHGRIGAAARALGISRATLYRKLRKHKIPVAR